MYIYIGYIFSSKTIYRIYIYIIARENFQGYKAKQNPNYLLAESKAGSHSHS